MLDIHFIRENLDEVKRSAQNKNIDVDIDAFLKLDDSRKEIGQKIDELRTLQNEVSKNISQADEEERQRLIGGVSKVKEDIKTLEETLKPVMIQWKDILMNIPNIHSPDMPVGANEEENVTIKTWGEPTEFSFEPKNHIELGKSLDIIDIDTAAEVSGSRFYYLKGDLVLMQFALVQYTMQTLQDQELLEKIIAENNLSLSANTFMPMLPPVIMRKDVQKQIHRYFGDQTYTLEGEEHTLVASAEHTLAPYFMNKTLEYKELPQRFVGYSTAFRREAGTYGKDMGGILRVHHFDKIEIESFTDSESGPEEQKFIVALQEHLVQSLGIPYQLQHVCTGDTGKPDYNQFDIECWLPGQQKYRETHTSDYMTDFQTRGISSFYKDRDGKKKLLHTNDATAFAISRILIAIMENGQQEDGTIVIPEVLRPFMGGKSLIS